MITFKTFLEAQLSRDDTSEVWFSGRCVMIPADQIEDVQEALNT